MRMEGGARSGGAVMGSKSGRLKLGKETKRKRRRMVSSDSEEPYVRKGVDKESGCSSMSNEVDHVECGKKEVDWIGKKRKLDVFEFDEYDRFDEDHRLKKDCGIDGAGSEEEGKTFLSLSDGQAIDSEEGTSGGKVIVYKRRSSFKSGSNRSSSARNKITKQSMNKNADSLFSSKTPNASLESTRVQDKKGALKVQVNKPKGSNSHKTCSRLEAKDYETSKDGTVFTRNQVAYSSSFLEARFDDQSGTVGRAGKAFLNLHKSMSSKIGCKQDLGFDDSDTSSESGRDLDSSKAVSRKRCEGNAATPHKSAPAVSRSVHGSSKCRGGTEKQRLREHIKQMLLDAGWTIDYRPRRDRGYNDAVYVNTSGTSYWSIIKAYDALQKEVADRNERITSIEESSFSPLPETILCKLTRSTRQNMKKEKKIKHRKNGRSGHMNRASARSSKPKYESEETTSDEDDEEEKPSYLTKKFDRSLKTGNSLSRNSGSRHLGRFSHDEDLEYGESNNSRSLLQARKNKKLGKCTLLVRSANKGMNPNDGYVPYTGKRTLLSWLIDCGTVEVSEKIQFMNRTRKKTLQQGWITRDGIHCVCCCKSLTVANFEIHAGSKLLQPLQHIITESGVSLSQCLLDAWNQKAESAHNYFHNVDVDGDDPNDDTCSICGDGGDLICCDGCPSTFHQNCLGIEVLPAGDWHCPQCICIHCGMIDETAVNSDTSKCSLQTCSLCEMKYHFSCLMEVDSYADDSSCYSFCGTKCEELHKILQKSVGVRYELEEGFSWSLIRRTIVDSNDSVLRTQNLECNAKLAVAQTIMDECFLPIVDRRSQVNLIHNVLYNCGSNFNRLNYQGFYTAILEKGDEVISAASLRFHGTQFAEMPFIGTRHIYRRQGMCRRLFSAIESALRSYKVEKLVIPAISDLLHTWTEVFGFHHLEQSDKEKLRSFNIMVFPGVDMLKKVLIEKDRLEDEAFVKTGLYNINEVVSGLVCLDSGAPLIPNSPLDDKHACSDSGNGIVQNMNNSCFANECEKVCVDDGVVTNNKSAAPDLGGSLDCPCTKELLPAEDENTAPEIKSECESKCPDATHCGAADANMESGLMSESFVGNDVQSAEEAGNNNLPGSCNAELDSSDGCVELFPSDNCTVLIACTNMKTNSRPLKQCTPPHTEDRQSLDEEVISNAPTHLEMVSYENSCEVAASATKSSTLPLPLHISNGDTSVDYAKVRITSSDSPSKERDSHEISSPISTTFATAACVERDEDVDMNPLPYTDPPTFSISDIVIDQ